MFRPYSFIFLAAIFSTLFLAGCSSKQKGDPELTIGSKVGGEFAITLPSNRTTGYEWQLARPLDEQIVTFVRNTYEPPQSPLMGAGGTEIWTFKAVGEGETEIAFQYVRPWEKDVPPADQKTFRIIIR